MYIDIFRIRGSLIVLLLAVAISCKRYPLGRLAARVVDANNAPVGGVAADLYKVTPSGNVYWRAARTSGNGMAVFGGKQGVIEGEYIVHVTLMPWQKLAPGEKNDRAVRLRADSDVTVSFRVVPRVPDSFLRSLPADSSQSRHLRDRSPHA